MFKVSREKIREDLDRIMKQDESTRGPPASLLRKNTSEDMGLSMNQNTG